MPSSGVRAAAAGGSITKRAGRPHSGGRIASLLQAVHPSTISVALGGSPAPRGTLTR